MWTKCLVKSEHLYPRKFKDFILFCGVFSVTSDWVLFCILYLPCNLVCHRGAFKAGQSWPGEINKNYWKLSLFVLYTSIWGKNKDFKAPDPRISYEFCAIRISNLSPAKFVSIEWKFLCAIQVIELDSLSVALCVAHYVAWFGGFWKL